MKLLRFVLIFLVIYFIRRFIQAYQALKITNQAQEAELARRKNEEEQQQKNKHVVDAEFKVMDR